MVWIIVMFLSAVWTLILTAPIHCRASIAETLMQCYISPNLMKKQSHLHLGWVHFLNYSFKHSFSVPVCMTILVSDSSVLLWFRSNYFCWPVVSSGSVRFCSDRWILQRRGEWGRAWSSLQLPLVCAVICTMVLIDHFQVAFHYLFLNHEMRPRGQILMVRRAHTHTHTHS